MSKFTTILFKAKHDRNGNPRRVYVTLANGKIVATYGDEYADIKDITNIYHRRAFNGCEIETTPTEYRSLLNYDK